MAATLLVLDPTATLVDTIRSRAPESRLFSCETPAAALRAAGSLDPDALLVGANVAVDDVQLVISSIRVEPSRVAYVPIVLLSDQSDDARRLELLRAGADVLLPWPISPEELVLRLGAVLAFARRLGEMRPSSSQPSVGQNPTPRTLVSIDLSTSSSGEVGEATIAMLLALIEVKQASGHLSIGRSAAARQRLVVEIRNGHVIGGCAPGEDLSAEDATDAALRWSSGHYEFVPIEESELDGELATRRRTDPQWAASRPAKSSSPALPPRSPSRTSPQPIRRETLQSQPAYGKPDENNRRSAPVVTVETAKKRASKTLTGVEGISVPRKGSGTVPVVSPSADEETTTPRRSR